MNIKNPGLLPTPPIPFMKSDSLTLGVEVELQLINAKDFTLTTQAKNILAKWPSDNIRLKPEIFQSMLEIDTPICHSATEAEKSLLETSLQLRKISAEENTLITSNATHPFAQWRDRILFPQIRYEELIEKNQHTARRLMIYGTHIHIGMETPEICIQMMNKLSYYLAHLLALSASSPYWQGTDTGMASSRVTIFESHPAAGSACSLRDWKHFEELLHKLIITKSIGSTKDLWWDLRPCPHFGTLEIRICDGMSTISHTARVVAFTHLLAKKLLAEVKQGQLADPPEDWLMRENKWRAARRGIDANVIINNEGETRCIKQDIQSLIKEFRQDPAVLTGELAYNQYFDDILNIDLVNPAYTRQREAFEKSNSLEKVVEYLTTEFDQNIGYK